LLPFFIRKQLGNVASVLLGFFLAVDPFLIANSTLITGNTLSILTACFIILSLLKGKYQPVPFFLIIMSVTGRGFTHFLLVFLIFLVLTPGAKPLINAIKVQFKDIKLPFANQKFLIIGGVLAALFFIAANSNLNILATDLTNFIKGIQGGYQPENLPWLYPVALLFYAPLAVGLVIASIFQKPLSGKGKLIVGWIAPSLLLTIVYPGHQVIDLVWVSIPLWVISALVLQKLINELVPNFKENFVFLIILFICFGNFYLDLFRLIYQLKFGLPSVETLIALLSIVFLILALVVYWAYLKNIKVSLSNFSYILIIFLSLAQISNASHTAGIHGNPGTEIFWDGYFSGKDMMNKLVATSTANIFGTDEAIEIWIDRNINPNILWEIKSVKTTRQIANETPEKEYPLIISSNAEPLNLPSLYLGQKFTAKEYPLWMRSPIASLLQADFWSWVFMRDSRFYHEYNYIWLKSFLSS
jgi:hypothetical protein